MAKIKVLFMGTPLFASTVLKSLISSNTCQIVGVFTKPDYYDRKKLMTSPVKDLAILSKIPVYTPDKLLPLFDEVVKLKPDIIITCAYGKIIPQKYLDKFFAVNIHASLLPKYRGASPIEHALFNSDSETGITIIKLTNVLDGGPIMMQDKINILDTDNKTSLTASLSVLASQMILDFIKDYPNYTYILQDETKVTLCPPISKEQEYLELNFPASKVIGIIKALSDKPGAKLLVNNTIVTILSASQTLINSQPGEVLINKNQLLLGTSDFYISIDKICQGGKKPLLIKDFLNGQKIFTSQTNIFKN